MSNFSNFNNFSIISFLKRFPQWSEHLLDCSHIFQRSHFSSPLGEILEFGAINQGFFFREKIGHFFGPCEMLLVYIFRWWAISADLRFTSICKSANFGSNHQFCPKPRPRMAGISLHHFVCNCGTFCSYCRYVAKFSVARYFLLKNS